MILNDEQTLVLHETLYSGGGRLILQMLEDEAKEPEDELYEIMSRKPDTLTGKTALKYAIAGKTLRKFRELLVETAKRSQP